MAAKKNCKSCASYLSFYLEDTQEGNWSKCVWPVPLQHGLNLKSQWNV